MLLQSFAAKRAQWVESTSIQENDIPLVFDRRKSREFICNDRYISISPDKISISPLKTKYNRYIPRFDTIYPIVSSIYEYIISINIPAGTIIRSERVYSDIDIFMITVPESILSLTHRFIKQYPIIYSNIHPGYLSTYNISVESVSPDRYSTMSIISHNSHRRLYIDEMVVEVSPGYTQFHRPSFNIISKDRMIMYITPEELFDTRMKRFVSSYRGSNKYLKYDYIDSDDIHMIDKDRYIVSYRDIQMLLCDISHGYDLDHIIYQCQLQYDILINMSTDHTPMFRCSFLAKSDRTILDQFIEEKKPFTTLISGSHIRYNDCTYTTILDHDITVLDISRFSIGLSVDWLMKTLIKPMKYMIWSSFKRVLYRSIYLLFKKIPVSYRDIYIIHK